MQLEESHAPYFEYHPPWRDPESEENEEASMDFDLGVLAELGLEVSCFLQGSAKSWRRRRGGCPPQTPSGRVGKLGDLESPAAGHAWLVAGTG